MIRENLIRLRGDRTQTEVASMLGIDQRYLSKLETGKAHPSVRLLARMARLYNTAVDEMFPDIFLN